MFLCRRQNLLKKTPTLWDQEVPFLCAEDPAIFHEEISLFYQQL